MVTRHPKVALAQDVHSNQDLELKGIAQLEAYDFFKDKRKSWRAVRAVGLEGHSKPVMLYLAFTVR
ncbi:hypothetical protein [Sphingomonas sp. RB1R13]|uniref:hypothetical protein n=1 Tax=Sphingomonas sp. RB1R13 TaxID=3096159 RepID=UPI002FCC3383